MTIQSSRPPGSVLPVPVPSGSLVVSCQARHGSPLRRSAIMAAMAAAAHLGGAAGIRADGPADVAAIAATVPLPVIGINKIGDRQGVYITPTFESARAVVEAGATMVAVDGTDRERPHGATLTGLVRHVHEELTVPVMADCDSLRTAEYAVEAGCDLIASTLSGYTDRTHPMGPNIDLIGRMTSEFDVPIVAEGRYATPAQVAAAFDAGAYAVVVGSAITDIVGITRRFASATPGAPDVAGQSDRDGTSRHAE